LRARTPEVVAKRLKLFMYGAAGSGKTTAAIQFPNAYIIDCEKGAENYERLIRAGGSVIFQTTDMHEVIAEVKTLLSVKHDYRTLVIDPITTVYNDLLEKCEQRVGSDHGRHYGEAGKLMKRLANLIMALDMNVVVTAHAKKEYGDNLRVLGQTFDGWRQLDYWFDLALELGKKGKKRFAKVVKTRVDSFPDEDIFEWSYEAVKKRYDIAMLEKQADIVTLATPDQVREIKELLNIVRLPEGTTDKWFDKSGVDVWEDMPATTIEKCIEFVRNRLPGHTGESSPTNGNGRTVPADPTSFGEYGDLMDDERFEEAVMNELKRRSFTDNDCTEAKAQACRMKNVAGLGAFPMKSRHEFLTAIRAGFMDQYKQQPTEPKQTTRRPARAAAGK
jgi:hypothetical protein